MVQSILSTPEFTSLQAQPLAPLPNVVRTPLDVFSEHCSGESGNQLNATVVLDLLGHTDELTQSDYDATYNAFMTTYNELGADSCHQILDLTIDMELEEMDDQQIRQRQMSSSSRALSETKYNNSSRHLQTFNFDFSLIFFILFRCNFCPNGNLLNNDASRRRNLRQSVFEQIDKLQLLAKPMYHSILEQEDMMKILDYDNVTSTSFNSKWIDAPTRNKSGNLRSLQSDDPEDNDGRCDVESRENCKGPKRIQFQERFAEILGENPAPSIDGVGEVSELKRYPCDEQIDIIDTAVVLKVSGDYNYLEQNDSNQEPDRESSREIRVMERVVRKAYNAINMANPETCDVEFRRVVDAKFVSFESISGDEFTMTFNLNYNCRDCASSPVRTLFDDLASPNDPGRQYYYFDQRERGPVEPPCTCAIGATFFRGPTPQEFSTALRKLINVRRDFGKLTFVTDIDPLQNDSVYETQPISPIFDDPLYQMMVDFPLSLQESTFGAENIDQNKFPLYPINDKSQNWPFLGKRKILASGTGNDDTANARINRVLKNWSKLRKGYDVGLELESFIENNKYKAFMVRGALWGSDRIRGKFLGIVTRYKNSNTKKFVNKLIPLVTIDEQESSKSSNNELDGTDDSCWDTFVSQAFENVVDECDNNDDSTNIVHVQGDCLLNIDRPAPTSKSNDETNIFILGSNDEIDNYNHAYEVESQSRARKYFSMFQAVAYGYADCVRETPNNIGDSQRCTNNIFKIAVQEYVKNRSTSDQNRGQRRTQFSSFSCKALIATARECLSCQTCSTEHSNVQCCQNSDCPNENDICANQSCFPNGNPHFTLTWEGDDDLELHVVSPTSGVDISSKQRYENESNPSSGGQWTGRGQKQQGSSTMVGSYAEHIYFPMNTACEEGKGIYEYFVKQTSQTGIKSDTWALSVFQDNIETNSYTSSGSSTVFTHIC